MTIQIVGTALASLLSRLVEEFGRSIGRAQWPCCRVQWAPSLVIC